jgi:TIR domain
MPLLLLSREQMPLNIFISYRQDDAAHAAGRIHAWLKSELKGDATFFMDIDNIPAGENFVKVLDNAIRQCDILLAVIGPKWLELKDSQGNRRIDAEDDFVRIEVAMAIEREIPVIPVTVDGARLPDKGDLPKSIAILAQYQGVDIRSRSFSNDAANLIKELKKRLPPRIEEKLNDHGIQATTKPTRNAYIGLLTAVIVGATLLLVIAELSKLLPPLIQLLMPIQVSADRLKTNDPIKVVPTNLIYGIMGSTGTRSFFVEYFLYKRSANVAFCSPQLRTGSNRVLGTIGPLLRVTDESSGQTSAFLLEIDEKPVDFRVNCNGTDLDFITPWFSIENVPAIFPDPPPPQRVGPQGPT